MPRSQKLSFPIPLRKSSAPATPLTLEPPPSESNNKGGRSTNDVMSKAQRILGASDTNSIRGGKKSGKKNKKLAGKSSFISITVSEAGAVEDLQDFRTPCTRRSEDPRQCSRDLHQRPSSPLLGQSYRNASSVAESVTDSRSRPLHQFGSSSTLRSFYDPQKSPLAVSQQTSASSARDFALRKGKPHVQATQDQTPSRVVLCQNEDTTLPSARTDLSPRKGPPRIDLSMLFPKPRATSTPLLSPHRLTNSPSPLSAVSEDSVSRAQQSKQNVHSKRLTRSPPSKILSQPLQKRSSPNDLRFAKSNVRKPKPGVSNWFDGPEGEVSEDESADEPQFESNFISVVTPDPDCSSDAGYVSHSSRPPSGLPCSPNMAVPKRVASSVLGTRPDVHLSPMPITPSTSKLRLSLRSWEARSNQSLPSRIASATSKQSTKSVMDTTNLQEDSVLCLSSSEDEEEDEVVETEMEDANPKPVLRESVTNAYDDTEIQVLTAEAVKTTQSPPMSTIARVPPARRVNATGTPKTHSMSQRHPLLSVQKSFKDRPESWIGDEDCDSSSGDQVPPVPEIPSEPLSRGLRNPSSTIQAALQRRKSRVIMAVTRQEESLLAAMRQKRASMRQSIFAEGYQAAQDQGPGRTPNGRPRTSGEIKTDSSFLRLSPSSLPLRPTTSANSAENRMSFEGSDFHLNNGVLSRASLRTDQRTDQSSRVSLIHSDALPSPSTSRASPITPTLASLNAERRSHRLSATSPSFSPSPNTVPVRHSRRRTDSSNVIMLDGIEDSMKDQVEDEDFPIWAYSGWSESAGLTVVH